MVKPVLVLGVNWSRFQNRLSVTRLVAHNYRSLPGFCSMKRLGVLLDGMVVLGSPDNSPVLIYTPGWREAMWELSVVSKNTTQMTRPGLEPGPLDQESSALTTRPPRLPHDRYRRKIYLDVSCCCCRVVFFILIWLYFCHLRWRGTVWSVRYRVSKLTENPKRTGPAAETLQLVQLCHR